MKNNSYLVKLTALSLVFIVLTLLARKIEPIASYVDKYNEFTVLYMTLLAIVSSYFHKKAISTGDPHDMYNFNMLASTVRLLSGGAYMFLYFFIVKEKLGIFILNFFILYFSYTIFEIKTLFSKLQTQSKKD
jgi:hypothetical protein